MHVLAPRCSLAIPTVVTAAHRAHVAKNVRVSCLFWHRRRRHATGPLQASRRTPRGLYDRSMRRERKLDRGAPHFTCLAGALLPSDQRPRHQRLSAIGHITSIDHSSPSATSSALGYRHDLTASTRAAVPSARRRPILGTTDCAVGQDGGQINPNTRTAQ